MIKFESFVCLFILAGIPFFANAQDIDCEMPGATKQALGLMDASFKSQKQRHTQRFAKLDETVNEKMRLAHWSKERKTQFFSQLIETPRFRELQNDIEELGLPFNGALNDVDKFAKAGRFDEPALCRRILDVLMLSSQVDAASERQVEFMASQIKAAD